MGDAYIPLHKYREAIEVLEKVLELSKPEDIVYRSDRPLLIYDRMRNYAQARFHYRKAAHLNSASDSKTFYKIACTYYNEGQWKSAIQKQFG